MTEKSPTLMATCQCGRVAIEATGHPILSVACYCNSCKTAGLQFESAPGAPTVLNVDAGTEYCLYRKDKVNLTRGGNHLQQHRLTPEALTRRVVATCCNSPIFLDFVKGHWLTLYRDRLSERAAPVEMGVMTEDRDANMPPIVGIRTYKTRPGNFMIRLLAAWVAMGFKRPRAPW